jgi:hypothetical protein
MTNDYIVPEPVTRDLLYHNTSYAALEQAFIKPDGKSVTSSPFVKYVTQLMSEPTQDGLRIPVIMSKGFVYYMLDLKQGPQQVDKFYYSKRAVFAQSTIFGSLTAFSHAIPALFAIKEINGDISFIKDAIDELAENTGSVEQWTHESWGEEKGQLLADYMKKNVKIIQSYVDTWSANDKIDTVSWNAFCKDIYPAMINTFFLALVSEASALFDTITEWKNDSTLSDFNWSKVLGVVSFSTDNPLAGKPGSDFSLDSAAEYSLMRAFMIKIFGISKNDIDAKDQYAKDSKTSNFYSNKIFCFPTAVPGWPNFQYPANMVDQTDTLPESYGATYTSPNSVIMGSAVSSLYWSTLAQRNMADILFPEIDKMVTTEDAPARAFYDLLRRPQYGLRYTFVKEIADHYIDHGNFNDLGCPYDSELW